MYATQMMPTGGIESHLVQFCEQMSLAGVAIDLVVPNFRQSKEAEERLRAVCRRTLLCRNPSKAMRLLWLRVALRSLSGHSYNALYTNGQGASVLGVANRTEFRQWVHHHHMAGDVADQATWSERYWQALRSAKEVVACSNRNAVDLSEALSRSCVTVPCFSRRPQSHHEIAGEAEGRDLRFGYYGRLIPEKGVDVLARLSEDPEVRGIEFHLWGEGSAYPPEYFVRYPKLRYHGSFATAEELSRVLGLLDAYLLISSHSEGLPISLLEAMSVGIPWIATERGGIPDIACDPISTRVVPTSATYPEIKASILSLASDIYAGRVDHSIQKRFYDERFSPEAVGAQWVRTLGLGTNQDG